jgi:hypothetical protein
LALEATRHVSQVVLGAKNLKTTLILRSKKEIFPLIKDNELWGGYTNPKEFMKPDGSTEKLGNCQWWTNLDVKKRHEELPLYEKYDPAKYPKYANYDAIEVGRAVEIPLDYDGEMGVPISFLDKYNPEQFEIIGQSRSLSRPIQTQSGPICRYKDRNGYMRQAVNERFCLPDGDTWRQLYDRVVIKRKTKK